MRKKLLQHTLFAAITAWAIYLAQGEGPDAAGVSHASGWGAAPMELAWR